MIAANTAKAAQEIAAKVEEARAEYLKAQAENEKAQAALANAQAESAKVAAEKAAEQAKIDLEKAQAELEKYKMDMAQLVAQYEAQLYQQKLDALTNKKKYEDAVKNADKNEIAALMTAYQKAADALLKGQQNLAKLKLDLAKLEADPVTPQQSIQNQITDLIIANNSYQSQINGAQAFINSIRDEDYAEAEAALPEAQKTLEALERTRTEKAAAASVAQAAKSNATNALTKSDYAKAAEEVSNLSVEIGSTSPVNIFSYTDDNGYDYELIVTLASSTADPGVIGKYCAITYTYDPSGSLIETNYIPLFSDVDNSKFISIDQVVSVKDEYGQEYNMNYPGGYYPYITYYNLVPGGMDKFVSAAKTFVENGAQKDFDNAKKAYDAQAKVVADIQKLYDALEPLQKAWQNAETDKKPEAEAAFAKAVKDQEINGVNYDTYYQSNGIVSTVSHCESNLNSAKSDLTRKLREKIVQKTHSTQQMRR